MFSSVLNKIFRNNQVNNITKNQINENQINENQIDDLFNNKFEDILKLKDNIPNEIIFKYLHYSINIDDNDLFNFIIENFVINYPEFFIDITLDQGKKEMFKILKKYYPNKKPSLFAKQCAEINGYSELANYVDNFIGVRNNINVHNVYKKYIKKKFIWNSYVPNEYKMI